MSESRKVLLDLIAERAKTASPELERSLRELAHAIEDRGLFFVDVLTQDRLGRPDVSELLDNYGSSSPDPERFLKTLEHTIRYGSAYGERPWRWWTPGAGPAERAWRYLRYIRCPHCTGLVSRRATVCRHCGRDLPLIRGGRRPSRG